MEMLRALAQAAGVAREFRKAEGCARSGEAGLFQRSLR